MTFMAFMDSMAVSVDAGRPEPEGGEILGNRVESQELIRLGSRIRERRLSAGLSQEALAEKAGISPNTVSRIEGGLTEMYVKTFRKLAHALGADAGDLLCKKEQSDRHIKSILRRISHMEKREQEIVAQTVSALADALEKNRY